METRLDEVRGVARDVAMIVAALAPFVWFLIAVARSR